MTDKLSNINLAEIKDTAELQKTLEILVNAIEELEQRNQELEEENRRLGDENARLKGGNARPVIKSKNRPKTDISSGGKERGSRKAERVKDREPRRIAIDKEIRVEMDTQALPADAIFKGYESYRQQDLEIRRNNKRFLVARYYSPSEKKTYQASLPPGEVMGHFGSGVRSLVNVLHHYGNVTESSLAGLMEGFGIQISPGSISNILKTEHDWSVGEQAAILQLGLAPQTAIQMDGTGNRQRGEHKTTHIITAPLFSVFYTLNSKSRLDCLRALQGSPAEGVQLMWGKAMEDIFRGAKVSKPDSSRVMELLKKHGSTQLSLGELDNLLKKHAPAIYRKGRIVSVVKEVMALYYYNSQKEYRRLKLLLTDDAPEYKKISENHGLCWIHDARYYNKLSPRLEISKQRLETFRARYWEFYQTLLDYKNLPAKKRSSRKLKIMNAFDNLFRPETKYGQLDLCSVCKKRR